MPAAQLWAQPTGTTPHGLVLGIESSCDDTGVAVMTPEGHILGQALATQADVHRYAEPLSCILWTAVHDRVCCFNCCTDVTLPTNPCSLVGSGAVSCQLWQWRRTGPP